MLPNLWGEYTQEDLYQIAISRPLEEKIASAIALIQTYEGQALQLSPDGYYVAFSGGKDSIVLERLFQMAGVKYQAWYNNVTIDPPELVQFIKKQYPAVKWNNPEKHLTSRMADKSNGPPTRLARWCCEIYKEQGGDGLFKSIGVRAEESARRKGLWREVTNNRRTGLILCPILHWTEADIWQFIHDNDMPYCSLYDEGFKRLGCVGCPMGGPAGQARDFARWPKYEALWRRGFQKYWDTWKGVPTQKPKACPQCHGIGSIMIEEDGLEVTITCLKCNGSGESHDRWIEKMQTVDDLWNWWVSGKAYEGEGADCQMWLW